MIDNRVGNLWLGALGIAAAVAVVAGLLTHGPRFTRTSALDAGVAAEAAAPGAATSTASTTSSVVGPNGTRPTDPSPTGASTPPSEPLLAFGGASLPVGSPSSIPGGSAATQPSAGAPEWPSVGALVPFTSREIAIYDAPEGRPIKTLENPLPPSHMQLSFGVLNTSGDWLQVGLPTRPNGSIGWIRTSDVGLVASDVSVDVDLMSHWMTIYDKDRVLVDTAVTTGTGSTPTPTGEFYVTGSIRNPGGAYGSYAFGISGHSDVLTDFAGGDGEIAIHGTDEPDLVGQSASHGCVRVTNQLAIDLAPILSVGVRVRIHD